MKITDIHTYLVGNSWKNWLFVKVETNEGISGIGEGTLNAFAKTVEAAIHELKHLVMGMSPFDVETISLKMLRDVYSDGGQIQGSALAAIEMACWDIMGKATSQPVYKLLGANATISFAAMRTAGIVGVPMRKACIIKLEPSLQRATRR
ncbi:hypothetical protein N6H14_04830 [Paenibacillus sp. CC-CFT747]|nr:hypothetical protein N6H14_04830 [Paenibacillus sp. CC-CFT747]